MTVKKMDLCVPRRLKSELGMVDQATELKFLSTKLNY